MARKKVQEIEQAEAVLASNASRLYRRAVADPGNLIEIIVGAESLKDRALASLQDATREVMVLSRPPYIQSFEEGARQSFKEGVRRRYIYDEAALAVPGHLAEIERDVKRGEEARVVPKLPMKLLVTDRCLAYVALDPSDPEVGAGLVVRPSSLLDALVVLFEMQWGQALPLRFDGGADRDAELDARLLGMLMTGLTDEAVARQLGISTRSLSRRISRLQDELGARNRFQMGVQAVRLNRLS